MPSVHLYESSSPRTKIINRIVSLLRMRTERWGLYKYNHQISFLWRYINKFIKIHNFSLQIYNIWRLAHYKFANVIRRRRYSEVGVNFQSCHLPQFLRQLRYIKSLFPVSCMSLAFSLFWVQLASRPDKPATDSLAKEVLVNVGRNYRYKNDYRKPD